MTSYPTDILAILFLGYLEMRHQVWYIMGKPRYAKNKDWAGHRTDPGARSHINRTEYKNLLTLGIKARPCKPEGQAERWAKDRIQDKQQSHKKIT